MRIIFGTNLLIFLAVLLSCSSSQKEQLMEQLNKDFDKAERDTIVFDFSEFERESWDFFYVFGYDTDSYEINDSLGFDFFKTEEWIEEYYHWLFFTKEDSVVRWMKIENCFYFMTHTERYSRKEAKFITIRYPNKKSQITLRGCENYRYEFYPIKKEVPIR